MEIWLRMERTGCNGTSGMNELRHEYRDRVFTIFVTGTTMAMMKTSRNGRQSLSQMAYTRRAENTETAMS